MGNASEPREGLLGFHVPFSSKVVNSSLTASSHCDHSGLKNASSRNGSLLVVMASRTSAALYCTSLRGLKTVARGFGTALVRPLCVREITRAT